MSDKLEVHGFVLAGGKSSRMGTDKALLDFRGEPMVALAVRKLQEFCADVSVAGNRDDLAVYAPVVLDALPDQGPAAGIAAALKATTQPWVLMLPVDLPLISAKLLRAWATDIADKQGALASFLRTGPNIHPVPCLLHRSTAEAVDQAMQSGERHVLSILKSVAGKQLFVSNVDVEKWQMFINVNTRAEWESAERFSRAGDAILKVRSARNA